MSNGLGGDEEAAEQVSDDFEKHDDHLLQFGGQTRNQVEMAARGDFEDGEAVGIEGALIQEARDLRAYEVKTIFQRLAGVRAPSMLENVERDPSRNVRQRKYLLKRTSPSIYSIPIYGA